MARAIDGGNPTITIALSLDKSIGEKVLQLHLQFFQPSLPKPVSGIPQCVIARGVSAMITFRAGTLPTTIDL